MNSGSKKNQIQFASILIGIGALFISIQPPDIAQARAALANIQLFWLIVILLSSSVIFLQLYLFVLEVERHYKLHWGVNVKETISLTLLLGWFYLIGNLFEYITGLYQKRTLELLAKY